MEGTHLQGRAKQAGARYAALQMVTQALIQHDDTPVEDKIVVLRRATWADYQRLLEVRGDASVPRIAYLEGELEIMTPSRPHESLKSTIGRLVEVWCLENDIEFSTYGSWTLEAKDEASGAEPDECYVFGDVSEPVRPDLAIEVVWTSGGIDKRAVYGRLGVREVWFWRRGRLSIHLLRGDTYEEVAGSQALAGIDLGQLASYLDQPTTSRAMREYRAGPVCRRRICGTSRGRYPAGRTGDLGARSCVRRELRRRCQAGL